MNKLLKKTKKGFTLVELLVVIAILAVLASVSVVGYLGFTTKARNSNAMTELAQVREVLRAELIDGNEVSATYESSNTIKMKYSGKNYYVLDLSASPANPVNETKAFKALFTDLGSLDCTINVYFSTSGEAIGGTDTATTNDYKIDVVAYKRTNGGDAYWKLSDDSITTGEYSVS